MVVNSRFPHACVYFQSAWRVLGVQVHQYIILLNQQKGKRVRKTDTFRTGYD